jgi:hypothetical protein
MLDVGFIRRDEAVHLHISRVRREGKTYEYCQLVESYRRADGMPTQRVVARLGHLTPLAIDNLRAALQASRGGQRVVLERRGLPKDASFARPLQTLRYLDLAVLLQLWRRQGLETLLGELLPRGQSEVAPADVIAALTLQRCVDPGSKLFSERWFPRTALPELLGIAPSSFNNTRLHRVLEQLDEVTPSLMGRLPRLYREQEHEAFGALFLDITDARFVGHGPGLAEKAKTKEGVIERKVGIVLLCNEHGYPLRWHVIAGKRPEPPAMHDMLNEVRGLEWLGTTPLVCDRAMGTSSELGKLLGRGLRFVTALRSNEFGAYTGAIPYKCVADLEPALELSESRPDPCLAEAARRIEQAGMQCAAETLYVLDLGVVQRDAPLAKDMAAPTDRAGQAMAMARAIEAMVQRDDADSFASAARKMGVTLGTSKCYRYLLRLDRGLQQDILDGKAAALSVNSLYRLARIQDKDAAAQRRAFDQLLVSRRRRRAAPSSPAPVQPDQEPEPVALRVRAVAYFNPKRFVDERRKAQLLLQTVQGYVTTLNDKLSGLRSKRTRHSIEIELDRMLRHRHLLDVFHVHVQDYDTGDGVMRYRAHLDLDVPRWRQRRRYDGFSLLVAHPDVSLSAVELCQLYRAKDTVEKDFQVIKSFIKLRPIWHRSDAKVRAHVTVCMLALLLERTLDRRLQDRAASMALEALTTCCLNRFEDGAGKSHYVVTQPDAEQRELLRKLQLQDLADGADLIEGLRPR